MATTDNKNRPAPKVVIHDQVFSQQFCALLRQSGMNENSQRLYLQLLNQEIREGSSNGFPNVRKTS